MNSTDYVIFGTASGLFAEGTGLLARARHFSELFEYRLPRDTDQIIPTAGAETFLRRPVAAESSAERFHLLQVVVSAFDMSHRPGHLGAGVLVPWGELELDRIGDIFRQLDKILEEARSLYLNEDGAFTAVPRPLQPKSGQSVEDAPTLHPIDTGRPARYRITPQDLKAEYLPTGIWALSFLEANQSSLVLVTSSENNRFPPFDAQSSAELVRQVEEEQRREQEIRETVQRQEQVSHLEERVQRLEARVESLNNLLYQSPEPASHGHDRHRWADEPDFADDLPDSRFEDSDDGFLRRERHFDPRFIYYVAAFALLLLFLAAMFFMSTKSPLVDIQAPPETEIAVFNSSCAELIDDIASSEILGNTVNIQIAELRSCINNDFSLGGAPCADKYHSLLEAHLDSDMTPEASRDYLSTCIDDSNRD
jgi:hypothetical protein